MIFRIESETLRQVRSHLIKVLKLSADAIDIETDEEALPPLAGDVYYTINPYGCAIGPDNGKTENVFNYVIGFRVCCFLRCADVPQDRRREIAFGGNSEFGWRLANLNEMLSEVQEAIRFHDPLTCAIRDALIEKQQIDGGFEKPFSAVSVDQKPLTVTGDVYNAGGKRGGGQYDGCHSIAAMKRGINFGNSVFYGSVITRS